MSIVVVLPSLGESVVEGTISQWLVKEGDRVERDQPLVEVTADKVDVEIPSPAAGIVMRIVAAAGEVVPIGAELARVDSRAHTVYGDSAAASHPAELAARAPRTSPPRRVRTLRTTKFSQAIASSRCLHCAAWSRSTWSIRRPRAPTWERSRIDLARVVAIREINNDAFRNAHGFSLNFLPFLVHATVRALREYPALNASVLQDAIVEKAALHIGIAVETGKCLVVPVVRHADRLSLVGLAEAIQDLASRARSKRLAAGEFKGGSFTISNPGRHGNLYGFAIINQPQVAILRMGEIVKRAVVCSVDGADAIAIRPTMHLALSYDHRAVDGAPANAFLHRVRELLERAEFDL